MGPHLQLLEHLAALADARPALARRTLAELRRSLEILERNLRSDDHTAGQMLRQSLIDELRILALEYELTSDSERVQVARLLHARFLDLARDATVPITPGHEAATRPA